MLRWALCVVLLAGCGEDAVPATGAVRGSAPADALWVMTYNVNFEEPRASGTAADATVSAIEAADADIVFLQETHQAWERRLRAALSERYPHIVFHHAAREGGMAVLSRYPIEEERHGLAPAGEFPAWRLTASTPLGEIEILHVHLHPPLDDGSLLVGYFTTSGARLTELTHHLGSRTPDLVLGDFNEGEGEALEHLASLGMRQAQTAWPPVELTWRWDTGSAELQGRPDHVLVGRALTPSAVQVMRVGGSDHRPLRVALERRR